VASILAERVGGRISLVRTAIDGSDEVLPTLFTFVQFNVTGPRSLGIRPVVLIAPSRVEMHLSFEDLARTLGVGSAGEGYNVVEGAVAWQSMVSLSDMEARRAEMVRVLAGGKSAMALMNLSSELAMHAAHLASYTALLVSPVYTYYTEGDYLHKGFGFDCSNAFGWGGIYLHRYVFATLCALYTSMHLLGFLRTFSLRDGVVRYTILFYLLLLTTPVVAALEVYVISRAYLRAAAGVVKSAKVPLAEKIRALASRRHKTEETDGLLTATSCAEDR
jgi:hypothetical protein